MDTFIKEISAILTTPPGNLTYHLVLAFSIAGALHLSISNSQNQRPAAARRLLFGLSVLLVLRLSLFIMAGLAWQGLVNDHQLLPQLDRGVTLLSLVLIVWLWTAQAPDKLIDAGSLLLALLTLTLFTLGLVWWQGQDPTTSYNATWPDQLTNAGALLLLLFGSILLLVRKSSAWGTGLMLFLLAGLGHALVFVIPAPTGDYSGLIRLAQMAAYPLLLALPGRLSFPGFETTITGKQADLKAAGISENPIRPLSDPELLEQFLDLMAEKVPADVCQSATRVIANTMLADLCLLVAPPTTDSDLTIQCGYDLIRQQPLPSAALRSRHAPILASAAARGLTLLLPASSQAADLKALASALGVPQAGHLLSIPITHPDQGNLFSLVLLTPYSNHPWSDEDQARLIQLAPPLAKLLHRSLQMEQSEQALVKANQALETSHAHTANLSQQLDEVQSRLQTTQKELEYYRQQTESLAALIPNQEVGTALTSAGLGSSRSRRLMQTAEVDSETALSELHLALEEVAMLQLAIAEADRKYLELKRQNKRASISHDAESEMSEEIASLVQELRQPMSAIMGYTDFLLGESIGILGALQRKFLERIKMSTERMNRLVEDLGRLAAPGQVRSQLAAGSAANLYDIVDEAVAQVRELVQTRKIQLHIDLSEHLPKMNVDRDSMIQVLAYLLDNAARITPESQAIGLRIRLEGHEYQQRYILIQVSDHGSGIPPEYMPRVFSRYSLGEGSPIPGVSENSVNMPIAKALVENMGGRIWIDSQPGEGASYSILIPLSEQSELEDLTEGGLPG